MPQKPINQYIICVKYNILFIYFKYDKYIYAETNDRIIVSVSSLVFNADLYAKYASRLLILVIDAYLALLHVIEAHCDVFSAISWL